MLDGFIDSISVNQRLTGHTDHYCFYVHNNSSTSQMTNTKIWFTVVPIYVTMGLGSSIVNGVEQTVNPDTNPPASVNFSQPVTEGNALVIGNIPAQQHKAVWIRRALPANLPPTASVVVRFKVESDNA